MTCLDCGVSLARPKRGRRLRCPECAAAHKRLQDASRHVPRFVSCADCQARFRQRSSQQVRCPPCQKAYRRAKSKPRRDDTGTCVGCGGRCDRKAKSSLCRTCLHLKGQACQVPWATCSECGSAWLRWNTPSSRCGACRTPAPPEPIPCAGCGERFTPSHGRRYCNPSCAKRHHKREAKHRRRVRQRGGQRVYFAHICERDGWRCHLCGRPVDRQAHVPHPLAPTRDHVVPLSLGGTHEPTNVRLAHFSCNTKKGTRALNEQLIIC